MAHSSCGSVWISFYGQWETIGGFQGNGKQNPTDLDNCIVGGIGRKEQANRRRSLTLAWGETCQWLRLGRWQKRHMGLAKRFVWIFSVTSYRKPEQTFWSIQYFGSRTDMTWWWVEWAYWEVRMDQGWLLGIELGTSRQYEKLFQL